MNNIKIAVPGAKSFTVAAPGELIKVDSLGNYQWNVTNVFGKEAKFNVNAFMNDGTKKHESKIFRIVSIPKIKATLKGQNCEQCILQLTKDELISLPLEIKVDDPTIVLGDYFEVKYFSVFLPNSKEIVINGTTINTNSDAVSKIKKIKSGSIINITSIGLSFPENYEQPFILPLNVMIMK